nr:probable beta-D-xylosidase 7 [Tanacetum cinerariifolium]
MCAYNRVNGVPNCADENLLTNIARKQWGFHGYITSDCDAVSIIYEVHKYAKTPEDAVAEVLKAGMDVNCGWYLKNYTKSAVQKKKLLESDVDRALSNLFTMRMRLGLFNGNPTSLPYGRIGPDQVCSKEHQEIALEAARNGIVLLKNSAKLLPLKKTISSLAVIGPNANSAYTLVGNYAGPPCKSIEPLKALYSYVKNIQYHKACNYVNCTSASIDEAVKVAKNADYVVLFMGLDQGEEREDFDRLDLVLPGQQQALITAVAKAAKKPVILVMICGGPVDISFAKRDPKIGGILWGGYPGEAGGIALAEIIFGDHNPGMDVNCGWYLKNYTKSAVQKKKLLESDVDRALSNLFTMRMRLGLFNGNPTSLPYGRIGPDQVCSKEHQEIALEAARNGIVLLKNSAKLLPLKKTISSLAVIGPNANSAYTLVGNYAGPPCKSIEPLKALYSYVKNIQYHKACNYVNCTSASIDEAVKVAKNADYVVLFMGLDQGEEREDFDRLDLVLPGQQQALITAVAKAAKKPVILVMICGGPVDISFAKRDPKIGGILWGGYPGEAGGIALAEIIFGDHNPGGKLPMTWYPKEFVKIPMTDMRMRPQPSTGYPGRTYRFYTGRKVYRFGYGLSYSKYSYEFVTVTQNKLHLSEISSTGVTLQNSDSVHYTSVMDIETESCKKAKFSATVGVQNHGEMDGKHAVLLFVKQNNVANGKPMKQLAAFDSVKTTAGERVEVEFVISPCEHFRTANEDGLMVIEEGSHYLAVGDQQYPISVLP